MDNVAKQEDGDFLLPRRLWVKKAVWPCSMMNRFGAVLSKASVTAKTAKNDDEEGESTRGRAIAHKLRVGRNVNDSGTTRCIKYMEVLCAYPLSIVWSGLVVGFKYTYLYCITHDGLMILDNKVDVLMMGSEHQGLRANVSQAAMSYG